MKDELAAVIDELLAGNLSPGRRYEKLDTGDDLYSVRLSWKAPGALTTTTRRTVAAPSCGSVRIGPSGVTLSDIPSPPGFEFPPGSSKVRCAGPRCCQRERRLPVWPQAAGAGPAAQQVRHILQSKGDSMGNDESGFFNTRREAAYLDLSSRTLDGCRVSGEGPAFRRFGNRVRYRRSDLDAWAAKRRATTTAEADRLGGA